MPRITADGVYAAATYEWLVAPAFVVGDVTIKIGDAARTATTNLPTIEEPGFPELVLELTDEEYAAYLAGAKIRFIDLDEEWIGPTLYYDADAELGPGAVSYPVKVCDSDNNPIDGAEVWITTDLAGLNTIAGTATTNAQGDLEQPFMLDPGTYYLWRQRAGYNFASNPLQIEVANE